MQPATWLSPRHQPESGRVGTRVASQAPWAGALGPVGGAPSAGRLHSLPGAAGTRLWNWIFRCLWQGGRGRAGKRVSSLLAWGGADSPREKVVSPPAMRKKARGR